MTVETKLLDEYHSLLESVAKEAGSGGTAQFFTISVADEITPSDTLLVIDMQVDFLPGGAFGVAEGDQTIDGICDLMKKFHGAGATVLATREYHPRDHCSFFEQGGPFPAHCVQGTRGSFLDEKIAATMQPYLKEQEDLQKEKKEDAPRSRMHVVYKGISRDIDSFGGFRYQEHSAWRERLAHNKFPCHGTLLEWTGAYTLFSSTIGENANAPPDVMSVLDKRRVLELLPKPAAAANNDAGRKMGRVFVCGLAYDFCVADTAANYAALARTEAGKTGDNDYGPPDCYIVQDLTRAAHIPGVGKFGTGFLTDPKTMFDKLRDGPIGLVRFAD